MDEQCVEKNHLFVKIVLCVDEFLKIQFNIHLHVEMVLRVERKIERR